MWILSDTNLTDGKDIICIKKTNSELDDFKIVTKNETYTLFFNFIEMNIYNTYEEAFAQLQTIFNALNSDGTNLCVKLAKGEIKNFFNINNEGMCNE